MLIKSPSGLLDFSEKVVLVTGGGSGVGTGIALRFAQAGANIVISDLNPNTEVCNQIEQLGRRVLSIQTDISDPDQVKSLFLKIEKHWSTVDVLINNAGIYSSVDLLSMTPDEWDDTLDVNLKGVFLCTQAAAKQMIAGEKGGAIVNIASIEALNPASGHSHYAASKAGVVMFSNTAALELGKYGIRINTISPGLMFRPSLPTDWPEGYTSFITRAPLQRAGHPEDIGDACLFMASDAARWITGAHLVVDGGIMTCQVF
jgi:NAD(P)-dependent dehydrogenase (short-subunit alcohol dehydrogenase family)